MWFTQNIMVKFKWSYKYYTLISSLKHHYINQDMQWSTSKGCAEHYDLWAFQLFLQAQIPRQSANDSAHLIGILPVWERRWEIHLAVPRLVWQPEEENKTKTKSTQRRANSKAWEMWGSPAYGGLRVNSLSEDSCASRFSFIPNGVLKWNSNLTGPLKSKDRALVVLDWVRRREEDKKRDEEGKTR